MNEVHRLCGVSRQAHHQALVRSLKENEKAGFYIQMMQDIRKEHPGMGLRSMYEMLQPDGIGRDAFICLGLEAGFRLQTIQRYTRTTYSVKSNRYKNLLVNKVITGINQVWSSDITYYYFEGRFYYIVLIMDVYSRAIIGYSIADNMRAEQNLTALKTAVQNRKIYHYDNTLIHHSDRGTQYAADAYTTALNDYGIQISMCKEVYENTHIERVNGTIKNQYLNRWNIQNLKELKNKLARAIHNYNHTKPHQSLYKLSPFQYEKELEKIPPEHHKQMIIYTTPDTQKSTQIESNRFA
jgi:transposase InsO family protein